MQTDVAGLPGSRVIEPEEFQQRNKHPATRMRTQRRRWVKVHHKTAWRKWQFQTMVEVGGVSCDILGLKHCRGQHEREDSASFMRLFVRLNEGKHIRTKHTYIRGCGSVYFWPQVPPDDSRFRPALLRCHLIIRVTTFLKGAVIITSSQKHQACITEVSMQLQWCAAVTATWWDSRKTVRSEIYWRS